MSELYEINADPVVIVEPVIDYKAECERLKEVIANMNRISSTTENALANLCDRENIL